MGFPSKVEIEAYTDDVAARLAANLAGFRTEYQPRTVVTLFDLVDASADPDVQNALGPAAFDLDEQSLPENLAAALLNASAGLAYRPKYRAFLEALSSLAKSAAGGAYANLEAALFARAAVIHPLAAEVERSRASEGAFTVGGDIRTVAAPAYATIRATRVYRGTDGAWTDESADASSPAAADVPLLAANGDKVLIGSDRPFSQVIAGLSTLGSVDAVITVKYWNGNAFVAVAGLVDNSVGFTKNQNLKFTLPADWTRTAKDGSGNALVEKARLYYLEITRTAVTVVTPPVATLISLVPAPILNSAGKHLGVPASLPQPPLALVRVTGVNTVVIEQLTEVDWSRFREPKAGQLVLMGLTPIAGTVTLTLPYTDDAGGNKTQAQSAWSSIDPLDTLAGLLSGTDGLRNVRTAGGSSVNTAVDGLFSIEIIPLRALVL